MESVAAIKQIRNVLMGCPFIDCAKSFSEKVLLVLVCIITFIAELGRGFMLGSFYCTIYFKGYCHIKCLVCTKLFCSGY